MRSTRRAGFRQLTPDTSFSSGRYLAGQLDRDYQARGLPHHGVCDAPGQHAAQHLVPVCADDNHIHLLPLGEFDNLVGWLLVTVRAKSIAALQAR